MNCDFHEFADSAGLAAALAGAVGHVLQAAIDERGGALLAVSGGKTPLRFFDALSKRSLAWDRIAITLVDERWVPADDARSNEQLVRNHLLKGRAEQARFMPLYVPHVQLPEDAVAGLSAHLAALDLPFDAVVLGMGNDGHTASFFPGGDRLAAATDVHTTELLMPMHAEGAGEPRITLTLPVIIASRHLYVHIEGGQKRAVFNDAQHAAINDDRYPISTVLRATRVPACVYWCP